MNLLNRGINLKIDSAIQELCETSNRSSSSTRLVLYLLVVISIIQLIVVLNTFDYSWHNLYINKEKRTFEKEQKSLQDSQSIPTCLHNSKIATDPNQYQYLERYSLENFEILKLPVVGVPIHVNDTGLASGIMLCILFLILVFTLEREEINLCIALRAITFRYTKDSDETEFRHEIKSMIDQTFASNTQKIQNPDLLNEISQSFLEEINRTRRNYHYNFLTMNEIFTQPNTNITEVFSTEGYSESNWKRSILKYKYWLVALIFGIALINDLSTYEKGFEKYGQGRTIGHLLIMTVTLVVLIILISKCQKITQRILGRYNNFRTNGYQFQMPYWANRN